MTTTAASLLSMARRFESDAARNPDRADALLARAAEARAEAVETAPAPTTARAPAAPVRLAPRFDQLNREQKIQLLAKASPFPLPAGLADRAIADGMTAETFALAVADHAIGAKAAAAHATEVEAVARSIIESDAVAVSTPHNSAAVEAMARRILEA